MVEGGEGGAAASNLSEKSLGSCCKIFEGVQVAKTERSGKASEEQAATVEEDAVEVEGVRGTG